MLGAQRERWYRDQNESALPANAKPLSLPPSIPSSLSPSLPLYLSSLLPSLKCYYKLPWSRCFIRSIGKKKNESDSSRTDRVDCKCFDLQRVSLRTIATSPSPLDTPGTQEEERYTQASLTHVEGGDLPVPFLVAGRGLIAPVPDCLSLYLVGGGDTQRNPSLTLTSLLSGPETSDLTRPDLSPYVGGILQGMSWRPAYLAHCTLK